MQKSLPLLRAVLLAFSLCLLAVPAAGQITFGTDTVGARPLSLSISGGISLGSYQAGVNYGLLEVYRHAAWNPQFESAYKVPRYRLRSVTGASAGNVNTLLWALEACTNLKPADGTYRSLAPESSLFWKVWLDIGWSRLFNATSSEMALFDRGALIDAARPHLVARMNDPALHEGCEVPAGITLTRIRPDTLRLQELPIETQRHATAFSVTVESGAAPLGTRVRFGQIEGMEKGELQVGKFIRLAPFDGDVPLDALLEAVKASASFPVAFAPVELQVWYPGRGTQKHAFVDGGFFDNNPVGLARALYENDNGTGTLDVLFVDPDGYRSRLASARAQDPAGVPNGGLAAVIATFAGAVPTARQYELQLLARERRLREREAALQAQADSLGLNPRAVEALPPGERLLLSSRSHPVLGEHLGSFGGFLARPGREFDFYVGFYDALYMAAWYHTCSDFEDATERGRQLKHRCVGIRLPELIGSEALVNDPARQVLARLYVGEYGPGRLDVPGPSEDMLQRVQVQEAFLAALETQFSPSDRQRCVDKRLVAAILCADGLGTVLDTLAGRKEAVAAMSAWALGCPYDCGVEPIFIHLLRDKLTASTLLLDGIVQRLAYVEGRMKVRPDARGSSLLKPVLGGQWLFEATYLRSRPLEDWFPNSVPTTSPRLRRLPVSYVGANLGTSGLEARYNPTINFRSRSYWRPNLILHFNGDPRGADDEFFGGAGVSGGWYFNNVAASEILTGVNVYLPLGDPIQRPVPEIELQGVFAASQLRLGLRVLPLREDHGRLHGPRGWAITAGLNDPVGLGYWLVRLGR